MNFLSIGAIGGFLAVSLSAFAAHALKGQLSAYAMGIFETAAQYQFYHSLALILVALLIQQKRSSLLCWSGRCFLLGMGLFSGSLYVLSLTGVRWIGAMTPVGGVFLLLGWAFLAIYGLKVRKPADTLNDT